MKPRNVLFIVMDQFRADLLFGDHDSLAGVAALPNIRALMGESASFSNYWTVVTPCGPARSSLLTGQYSMNHRSVRNGTPLDRSIPTVPTEMRKAGYAPMLFGYTDTSLDPRGRDHNDPALRNFEMPMPGFDEKVEMRLEQSHPWRGALARRGYRLPKYANFYVPDGPDPDSPAFYRAEDSDTAFLTDECLKILSGRRFPDCPSAAGTGPRTHPSASLRARFSRPAGNSGNGADDPSDLSRAGRRGRPSHWPDDRIPEIQRSI